ncbi:hypothetical protein [Flavobacterium orientale]|uniref:Uncharacterized protein n=1 Tax=Flavobacterium orientale TaxID=1756020 RepID=A0A916YA57_9FLAO|nr:hypothetical protein [Flavobacterium orientale]GGD36351.1 hypothetical protein GCM10011343_27760 [Flavobacterium orientale]
MRHVLTFIFLFFFSICLAQEKVYKSNECCSRTVTIVNDTILKYFERIGSFTTANTLNYKLDNGVYKVARNPNENPKSSFTLGNDLSESELIISKDSLVIVKTGVVFYDENYLEQKLEKEFLNFYIIRDKKITFITASIFNELKFGNYTFIELDRKKAKRKYGIDEKYKTFILKPK